MERIILGFDGSPASVSALAWVAVRASRKLAKVGVVNVLPRFTRSDPEAALDHLADAEQFLRERAPGTPVELHRLDGGVSDALTDFAESADLLVVGINPGHPIRATLAGAMPLKVSSQSHVPVVLVPAGWVESGDPVTVGISTDDSSDAALAFAAREAHDTDAAIRLVHAWLMPAPTYSGAAALAASPESVMAQHRTTINAAMQKVLDRYSTIGMHSELLRDSKAAALLRFASQSSMLVLGTHHRGVLAGSLLGSVAQEVLWQADCPVAVVPREVGTERYEPEW